MSEVTITGIFEKINNIFSLFKALLTPGKFQDSVLWQKEVLTILALGICLVAAISFISFNLISTLKKRQRNYKELVNALEEDGVEINYNLKPLIVDRGPDTPTQPTLENKKSSDKNEPQFEDYIEELTSKLDDDSESKQDLYDSHQIHGDTDTSVISPSRLKPEKKVFTLTQNHLTINNTKTGNDAVKVISLSMDNLKAEPANANKIINLEKDDLSQENIDTSTVTSAVENAPDNPETNHPLLTPTEVDNPSNGINSIDKVESENLELPDEYFQVQENDEGETSIWDEVEEVINDLDSFKPGDEEEINPSQFSPDETIEDQEIKNEGKFDDSIGLEAESVLAEFSNDEAWNDQEEILHELGTKLPHQETISSMNSNESSEFTKDGLQETSIKNENKYQSNTKKTVEFLFDEDDSRHESTAFIVASKSSDTEDGLSEFFKSENTDDIKNSSTSPHINNHNEKTISTELPLDTIENNSENSNWVESIANLPIINEQQTITVSDELVSIEENSSQIEDNKVDDLMESISSEDKDKIDEDKINQLLFDYRLKLKSESPNSNENSTSVDNQPEMDKKGNKKKLSQKTIKRIIDRLEFLQNNINKIF
jgi:hypothetical protein